MAHTLLTQVGRLVDTLVASGAKVVVHLSSTADEFEGSYLEQILLNCEDSAKRTPFARRVRWGTGDFMVAALDSLEYAASNWDCDWFSLISGQDLPVRPVAEHWEFLSNGTHDAHLDAVTLGSEACLISREEFRQRYLHCFAHVPAEVLKGRRVRPAAKLGIVMRQHSNRSASFGIRRRRASTLRMAFPEALIGSAWFDIAAAPLRSALATRHTNRLIDQGSHMLFSEEYLLVNLVSSSATHPSHSGATRFSHWHDPEVGTTAVIDESLMELVQQSGSFFARRFDLDLHPEIGAEFLKSETHFTGT